MRKADLLLFLSLICLLVLFPVIYAADETLTITTYYPSPYGSYNELSTASNTYLATSNGNVGIGTTNPGGLGDGGSPLYLHIHKSSLSGTHGSVINLSHAQTGTTYTAGGLVFGTTATAGSDKRYSAIYGGPDANSASATYGYLNLAVWNNGAYNPAVYIKPTGNVGIGTTGPGAKLNVKGNMGIGFESDSYAYRWYLRARNDATNGFVLVDNSENIRINVDTSGNVGIGTTNPGARLDVRSSMQIATADYVLGSTGSMLNMGVAATSGNTYAFFDNYIAGGTAFGSIVFHPTGNGNVGIGTTNPTAKLHIGDTNNGAQVILDTTGTRGSSIAFRKSGTNYGSIGMAGVIEGNTNNNMGIFADTASGGIEFYTGGSGTARGIWNSVGSVGIGTTNPQQGSTLNVKGSQSGSGNTVVRIDDTTAASNQYRFINTISGSGGSEDSEQILYGNGDITYDGTTSSPADYAEFFETGDTTIAKEEVVCFDEYSARKILRCDSRHRNIAGIVSTKPGVVGTVADDVTEAWEARKDDPSWKMVGLLGQVPTRVSTANGKINTGDYLAASDMPGIAVKAVSAGMVVGKALDPYDNPDPASVGTILVLVSPSYWDAGQLVSLSSGINEQQKQIEELRREIRDLKNK